ncbi:UNKNOWN [Stylonychia lemnae]|uniref:Uncharacterized protein n=1 Tax=Stylonychia lemnae TaxID=5949 RepID=A0A078AVL2_STYLE|nr:UNKNOWN [Stylonychia lemnae]|eukprot:CDW85307.1 UNKNOWN [Stylonychia lemnae]
MESSIWPQFLLESIEILVQETNNIAKEFVLNRSLKQSLLCSVVTNNTETKNSLILLYDRMKVLFNENKIGVLDLIKNFERFFNLRDKARDVFQGRITTCICDLSYALRTFEKIYLDIVQSIDIDYAEFQPHKDLIKEIKEQKNRQIKFCEQNFKTLKEAIMCKKTEKKEDQYPNLNILRKSYSTSKGQIMKELEYMINELGVQEPELYLQQTQPKSDVEEFQIKDLQQLQSIRIGDENHRSLMLFWFTHFKLKTVTTFDMFRYQLEEYLKLTIPDEGDLDVELSLENFTNPYIVSYVKDQAYLGLIIPGFNKDPIDHPFLQKIVPTVKDRTMQVEDEEGSERISRGTRTDRTYGEDYSDDEDQCSQRTFDPSQFRQEHRTEGRTGGRTGGAANEIENEVQVEESKGLQFGFPIQSLADRTNKTSTRRYGDGTVCSISQVSTNNKYLFSISKGSAQFSSMSTTSTFAQGQSTKPKRQLAQIYQGLELNDKSYTISFNIEVSDYVRKQLIGNFKTKLKVSKFSLNSSVLNLGSSQTQSDLIFSNNKRFEDNIIGLSYNNDQRQFRIMDLSFKNQHYLYVNLREGDKLKIFDGCILRFGNKYRYLFTYSENGSVLNMTLMEVDQVPQKGQSLSVGFQEREIGIGRNNDNFLVIQSSFLSKKQGYIVFDSSCRGQAVYHHLSQTSLTQPALKLNDQIQDGQISDIRLIQDLCGSKDRISLEYYNYKIDISNLCIQE